MVCPAQILVNKDGKPYATDLHPLNGGGQDMQSYAAYGQQYAQQSMYGMYAAQQYYGMQGYQSWGGP